MVLQRQAHTGEEAYALPPHTYIDVVTETVRVKTWSSKNNGTLIMGGSYGAVNIGL